MKLDKNFSSIYLCPKTGMQIFHNGIFYNLGVCPSCGHDNKSTITHYKLEVGKWNRPNFFERVFKGLKPEWVPKDQECKTNP